MNFSNKIHIKISIHLRLCFFSIMFYSYWSKPDDNHPIPGTSANTHLKKPLPVI